LVQETTAPAIHVDRIIATRYETGLRKRAREASARSHHGSAILDGEAISDRQPSSHDASPRDEIRIDVISRFSNSLFLLRTPDLWPTGAFARGSVVA
jgi:hypothetical protein